MHQCRLNTSDSCPPGKFRVRVRTRRVRDQVAGTQIRQTLSPTLQGACLTEKRGKDRGRRRGFKTEERAKRSSKEDQKRWQGLQTNVMRGTDSDNTSATAALHCVEIIHVESTKALHACYLRVGLLSNKVESGKHSRKGANVLRVAVTGLMVDAAKGSNHR